MTSKHKLYPTGLSESDFELIFKALDILRQAVTWQPRSSLRKRGESEIAKLEGKLLATLKANGVDYEPKS